MQGAEAFEQLVADGIAAYLATPGADVELVTARLAHNTPTVHVAAAHALGLPPTATLNELIERLDARVPEPAWALTVRACDVADDWIGVDDVLRHHDVPETLLVWAAAHRSAGAREAAAENHRTPEHAVRALAQDPDRYIRIAVCPHPNLPDSTVQDLVGDPDNEVRHALLRHRALTGAQLRALALDSDSSVAAYARFKLLAGGH